MEKIIPVRNASWVWVSYLGDSLVRELFMGAAQRFTYFVPNGDWVRDLLDTPLLGPHLGPDNDKELGTYIQTYHKSKLVCCGLPKTGAAVDKKENAAMRHETCLFAVHKSELYSEEQQETFKSFSFTNINEYLTNFVSPLFLGRFRCLSFTWAPTFDNATYHIREMHKPGSTITPTAIITNIGLHEIDRQSELDTLFGEMIKAADQSFEEFNTQYIMHSATHVEETLLTSKNETLRNSKILKVIDGIKRKLDDWKSLDHRYLDLYNISNAIHQAHGCYRPDGVHFEAKCAYQALITQWDFNWLRSIGALEVSSP